MCLLQVSLSKKRSIHHQLQGLVVKALLLFLVFFFLEISFENYVNAIKTPKFALKRKGGGGGAMIPFFLLNTLLFQHRWSNVTFDKASIISCRAFLHVLIVYYLTTFVESFNVILICIHNEIQSSILIIEKTYRCYTMYEIPTKLLLCKRKF